MRPVPLDPRLLYRGVLVNAASIAPINGIQFGVNTYLEEAIAVNGTSILALFHQLWSQHDNYARWIVHERLRFDTSP